MTNELEKQFFQCFGIEKIEHKGCSWGGDCPHNVDIDCGECGYWETWKIDYPQITERIYLELLATITCFTAKHFPYSNIEELKKTILKSSIYYQSSFDKECIQALFEEG